MAFDDFVMLAADQINARSIIGHEERPKQVLQLVRQTRHGGIREVR